MLSKKYWKRAKKISKRVEKWPEWKKDPSLFLFSNTDYEKYRKAKKEKP